MFWDEKENDPFEHEIEYDRLCASLTGRGAETFVIKLHASQEQLSGCSKLTHLHAVSELAQRYADLFYRDADFNEQRYRKRCCKFAGLLHEAMEAGGSFEDITDVADETVGRLVAALTPDRRIPRPKRRKLYINQVGRSGVPGHIIKLADMQHESFQLLSLPSRLMKPPVITAISLWIEEMIELLPVMGTINECPDLLRQVKALKANLMQLIEKCKESQ